LDLSSLFDAARYYQRERRAMKHATQLFPIALQELIEIGEKGMKQREQGERAGRVARPRETRACKHGARGQSFTEKEKIQLTFNLK